MDARLAGTRVVRVLVSLAMVLALCPLAGFGALFAPVQAQAATKGFYAVLDDAGTLTFTANRQTGGVVYEVPGNAVYNPDDGDEKPPWWMERDQIRKIVFRDAVQPTMMKGWFFGCTNLTDVKFGKLDTSKCSVFAELFECCEALPEIDLESLDTSQVKWFDGMFFGCKNLKTVKMRNAITAKTESLYFMFYGCTSLNDLRISGWDTSNVTDFSFMFSGCSSLGAVETDGFDTSSAKRMMCMFEKCSSAREIRVADFDTSHVTDFRGMFDGCSLVPAIDISSFDFSNAYELNHMFANCSSMKSIDFPQSQTASRTSLEYLFSGCTSLKGVDLTPLEGLKGRLVRGLFKNCTSLEKVDVSNLDNTHTETMTGLFEGCDSLRSVKLGTGFTFVSEDMNSMAYDIAVGERYTGSDLPEGEWVSSADGKVYAGDAIPSKVAATYTLKGWVDDSADEPADEPAVVEPATEPGADGKAGEADGAVQDEAGEETDSNTKSDAEKTTKTTKTVIKTKATVYQYQRNTMTFPEGVDVKLKWKSSNRKVATVKTSRDAAAAKKGGADVVAKKPGKATLTGTAKGCKVTVKLTVKKTKFKPVALKKLANYKELSKYMSKKQFKKAYKAALKVLRPLGDYDRDTQIQGMCEALRAMTYTGKVKYSMKAKHYNDPYGYLVKGVASCAGATRTAGLCLNILGYKYKHVNANQYTHQWCEAKVGKHTWTVDVFGGMWFKN